MHRLQVEALLDFRKWAIQQVHHRYQDNQLIHDHRCAFTQSIRCQTNFRVSSLYRFNGTKDTFSFVFPKHTACHRDVITRRAPRILLQNEAARACVFSFHKLILDLRQVSGIIPNHSVSLPSLNILPRKIQF